MFFSLPFCEAYNKTFHLAKYIYIYIFKWLLKDYSLKFCLNARPLRSEMFPHSLVKKCEEIQEQLLSLTSVNGPILNTVASSYI